MQDYYSVEEISKKIGISRQKVNDRVKKMGFDTKKLGDDEFKAILYDSLDVLQGKKAQSDILVADSDIEVQEIAIISNESGSTIEKRLELSKIEFDFITNQLEKERKKVLSVGTSVKTSNGNTAQSSAMKTYNDLIKSRNILNKEINELEEKLKLSKSTSEEKRSIIGDE